MSPNQCLKSYLLSAEHLYLFHTMQFKELEWSGSLCDETCRMEQVSSEMKKKYNCHMEESDGYTKESKRASNVS